MLEEELDQIRPNHNGGRPSRPLREFLRRFKQTVTRFVRSRNDKPHMNRPPHLLIVFESSAEVVHSSGIFLRTGVGLDLNGKRRRSLRSS